MPKPKTKPAAGEPIQLFKVLNAEGHSPYITAYAWSLPTDNGDGTFTPGAWHEEPASVFDKGHGLHVTPSPDRYWPNSGCVAYVCEAEGYREDPATESHVVALRVRLLRPIPTAEAQRISREYDAGIYARREKADQIERLARGRASARKAALRHAAEAEAGHAEGVESPALLAVRMLVELTPTASWRDANSCRHAALNYAVAYLAFDVDDVKTIHEEFKGHYWFGENGAENYYATAVACENESACVALEAFLGRKPWWIPTPDGRKRLTLRSSLTWEGVSCKVTSFDGDESFVACSYKKVTKTYGVVEHESDKVDRRFKITREAFRAAFAKKKPAADAVA